MGVGAHAPGILDLVHDEIHGLGASPLEKSSPETYLMDVSY
jgi:hypothetical protein